MSEIIQLADFIGSYRVASWAGHGWTDWVQSVGVETIHERLNLYARDHRERYGWFHPRMLSNFVEHAYKTEYSPEHGQHGERTSPYFDHLANIGKYGWKCSHRRNTYSHRYAVPGVVIGSWGQGVWSPCHVEVSGPSHMLVVYTEEVASTFPVEAHGKNVQGRDIARAAAILAAAQHYGIDYNDSYRNTAVEAATIFAEEILELLGNAEVNVDEIKSYLKLAYSPGHVFAGQTS